MTLAVLDEQIRWVCSTELALVVECDGKGVVGSEERVAPLLDALQLLSARVGRHSVVLVVGKQLHRLLRPLSLALLRLGDEFGRRREQGGKCADASVAAAIAGSFSGWY